MTLFQRLVLRALAKILQMLVWGHHSRIDATYAEGVTKLAVTLGDAADGVPLDGTAG